MAAHPQPVDSSALPVIAYLRADQGGNPIWSEDCVCEDPVFPSDPDGSDAECVSMAVVRLDDALPALTLLRDIREQDFLSDDLRARIDSLLSGASRQAFADDAPAPPLALDISVGGAQAKALLNSLAPDPETGACSTIRLQGGAGYAGFGIYVADDECPEEGSQFLAAISELDFGPNQVKQAVGGRPLLAVDFTRLQGRLTGLAAWLRNPANANGCEALILSFKDWCADVEAVQSLLEQRPSATVPDVNLAAAAEREVCAKHLERLRGTEWFAENVADEIRARGHTKPAQVPEDVRTKAAWYDLVRRGQHWSVINGIGDVLRGEDLDAALIAHQASRSPVSE